MILKQDNKKKLSDPLEEKILSPVFKTLNYNHHSPTSAEMLDGPFIYQKLKLTQEQRRLLEGNANMAAGVAVNDALQFHYADDIWKMNPLTKKLHPQKNEKLSQEAAIQKAVEKFKEYNPVNDKDRDKFELYQETIPQTIRQGFKACEQVGIAKAKDVIAEASINHDDDRLQLPQVGRTDLIFKDFNLAEQSAKASASYAALFLSVLEFKTVWHKPLKIKKDGSRGFSSPKLPSTPTLNHLRQLSFYTVSLSPLFSCCPYLIYLSSDGFQIYSKDNCADLEDKNIINYYEQFTKKCIRRERLLTRYAHLNDKDEIIENLIADTEPQFEHPFYWNIGYEYVKEAKELWSNIKC
jgi:ribosomal protein S16